MYFFERFMICLKDVLIYITTFSIRWGLKYSKYTTECYFGHVPVTQFQGH
jgi:hypothetical protein